ncbi:Carbonic anhydrase or acetyltransferase, isoleucine patch superfamily [Limimonas halophila]|uniref:Carbonic anhydrase or acetyltransferase, isoleucine patch superfamily n=1 Tax=Limimonas halophila TaxID=1082479 RepID=A0A1G7NPJ1_9PROT|nr:gamma carbonic anhydrase family protein [Limimonas halophila]SDF75893.1 Carbonic anhydrase or acetyltransferase, isoleucine patch superfamily [Limimonas halophila]
MSGYVLPFKGMAPKVATDAFIAENAVVIGDVEIGEQGSVWYGCVIRGDVNRIRIGARTNVQDGTVIHVNHDPHGDYRETGGGEPTWIGNDVTIGHMALIHACTIESGGFVGMRATVMDGAVVEGGAMVAAGALVTPNKRVPAGELWGGSPAKKMRDLTAEERANMPYQARHYAHLADAYLTEGL